MSYRAYGVDELPNLEYRETREQALLEAIERLTPEALAGRPQDIIVEETRTPKLSDFFSWDDLVSVMRERMQARIGNDDALTDEAVAAMVGYDDGAIAEALDEIAHDTDLRMDGFITVSKLRVERWWVSDQGDADV